MKRKILSLVLALALVLPLCAVLELPVFADDADTGIQIGTSQAYWKISADEKTLTISGTGAIPSFKSDGSDNPWNAHKSTITKVVIENGVTATGTYNFNSITNLKEVKLPDTLITLGQFAFDHCSNLTSIVIPASVTDILGRALSYTGLTKVVLCNTQIAIAQNAFSNTKSIAGGDIYYVGASRPTSVSKVGANTNRPYIVTGGNGYILDTAVNNSTATWHYNCVVEEVEGETHVYLSSAENNGEFDTICELCPHERGLGGPIGDSTCTWALEGTTLTISGTGTMPDYTSDTTTRPWKDFLSVITKVVIEGSVERVGEFSFFKVPALTDVVIYPGVTTIGAQSFQQCANLTTVYLPQSVEEVGEKAFHQLYAMQQNGQVFYEGSTFDRESEISWESNNTTYFKGISGWTYNFCLDCYAKGDSGSYKDDFCHVCDNCGKERVVNPVIERKLRLENDLTMVYMVKAGYFKDEEGYFGPNPTGKFTQKDAGFSGTLDEDGNLTFALENIDPSELYNPIDFYLNFTYAGQPKELKLNNDNIVRYCDELLKQYKSDTSAKGEAICTLVKDLMKYGTAAQLYLDPDETKLAYNIVPVEERYTIPEPTMVDETELTTGTVENASAQWASAGLFLEKAVTLRFKFYAESAEGLSVKITDDEGEHVITDFELGADGKYYFYYDGLDATQMRTVLNLAVYSGETPVSETLTYSVESYACAYKDDPVLGDLMKTMMEYGDSAAKYAATLAA